jgi:sigma-B regulation protein RsbU (phosphoserine phosphatase)
MATVRTAMRAVVRTSPPAEAMGYVAAALEPDLDRADAYVTLFLAQLDVAARRLTYVDAGHGHVFIRRADGRAEPLPCRGLPLGIQSGEPFQQGTVEFAPGDTLVLYSDGLTDARPDLRGDQAVLAAHLAGAHQATEMVERLVALGTAAGSLPDDLTVVALLLPETAAATGSQ